MNNVKNLVDVALSIGTVPLTIATLMAIIRDSTREDRARRAHFEYALALRYGRL